jgi:hypothetical protein
MDSDECFAKQKQKREKKQKQQKRVIDGTRKETTKRIGQRSDTESLIKLKCQRFATSDSKSRWKIKNKLAFWMMKSRREIYVNNFELHRQKAKLKQNRRRLSTVV